MILRTSVLSKIKLTFSVARIASSSSYVLDTLAMKKEQTFSNHLALIYSLSKKERT